MRPSTRDLATGIALAIVVSAAVGAEDAGRGDFHGVAALRCRHQGIGACRHRLQLQARALQQPGKPFIDAETAAQAGAALAIDQGRVHRQADPGLGGTTGQRRAQVASRNLVAAAGAVGQRRERGQRRKAQHQAQGRGRKRRRQARSVACQCGHCCALFWVHMPLMTSERTKGDRAFRKSCHA
ncbi:hypothetical protein D3C79_865580 [compost metagenome]